MTFLNPLLALGALAFLIPLAIHVLNRSRFKTVEWGAMHLLESVIKVNHKRFRLDQLILLLVRCLIPVLLALCIARPLLTGSKTMNPNTPVSLLVVLDTSYSMEAMERGGSKLKKAIASAKELVASVNKGSDVYVLQLGDQPVPILDQPVFDASAVVRRLDQVEGGYGGCDISAALERAIATIDKMSNAHRELVIISDFQKADWQEILEGNAAELRAALDNLKVKPVLTFMPVGKTVSGNVSIQSIDFPTKAIGAGEPHAYRVDIHNHGAAQKENARVIFRVNGKEESISQVSLAANGSTQVLFTHAFSQPGSHVVQAEVVCDDPLEFDNRFSVSMTIWDKLKVLLVDGDPSPLPLKSETDFINVALTPFSLGRFQLSDLIETETVEDRKLTTEKIDSAKVIVLANVSKLKEAEKVALVSFVEKGGVLFVFPGNRIDLKWYRESFFSAGNGILPAPFGIQKGKQENSPRKIVAQHFDHPSLSFFNERSNGDLSDAEITRWYQMEEPETPSSNELRKSTSVLARLDNADPFLMECSYGKGVTIQMATTCDADWTDLPMRPVFLPLIQQLVTTTASRLVPPRNMTTGEPAVAMLKGMEESQTMTVRTPAGSERVIQTSLIDGDQVATYRSTIQPGVYSFSGPEKNINFAIHTNRSESSLELLDQKDVEKMVVATGGTTAASSVDYLANDQLRRNGIEIWKYVLAGFLAFLFLEIVLQQRFSRARA